MYRPTAAASSRATRILGALSEPSALGTRVIPELAHETPLADAAALNDHVDAQLREFDTLARAHALAGLAALHQLREGDEGHVGGVGVHAGDGTGVAGVDGHQ